MKQNIHKAGIVCVVALWVILTAFAWFSPAREVSEAERRPLAQLPGISADAVFSGKFMKDFESYSLDQFPARDLFRGIKSVFHFYGLQQADNNDIYIADGFAVKQEYPLREDSVQHAAERFGYLYEKYLQDSGSRALLALVPDKGCYLAKDSGHLAMDYNALQEQLRQTLSWAEHIDILQALSAEDYYRTDIHWRQESLLTAAHTLSDALGIPAPRKEDYSITAVSKPFYGVYYGQAALPMEPDTMYLLESPQLQECQVFDYETGKYSPVYNMEKLESRDLYDIYLSGPRSLLTIENPKADTDRELILFRDSFGSSLAPLLVQGYAKIHLVDIRYIQIDVLDRFLTFDGQDVLFLYSASVLNNSQTIK